MTKFWAVVTVLIAVGLGLLLAQEANPVNFTDLETECRYDRGTVSQMDVRHDRLYFSGHFPVQNPEADLSYAFSQSNDHVTLNIQKTGDTQLTSFVDDCKAVAVYEGSMRDQLEPGRYTVTVKHAGEEVDKRIIRIG
ncbi:MAG: hypothetical protein ACI8Z7_000156 [Candidatus Nanohaloarchaea archaeon]|jgi:hypothetical protein